MPEIFLNYFKNPDTKRSPRFFKTTSKIGKTRDPKIFSNYFKNRTEVVSEILLNYSETRQGIPTILSFKLLKKQKRGLDILSSYFINQVQRIPEIFSNYFKNQE